MTGQSSAAAPAPTSEGLEAKATSNTEAPSIVQVAAKEAGGAEKAEKAAEQPVRKRKRKSRWGGPKAAKKNATPAPAGGNAPAAAATAAAAANSAAAATAAAAAAAAAMGARLAPHMQVPMIPNLMQLNMMAQQRARWNTTAVPQWQTTQVMAQRLNRCNCAPSCTAGARERENNAARTTPSAAWGHLAPTLSTNPLPHKTPHRMGHLPVPGMINPMMMPAMLQKSMQEQAADRQRRMSCRVYVGSLSYQLNEVPALHARRA